MAWKRVYVPGKGWRYTDGKDNYKTSNPTRSQYRNPANDVVDAGTNAAKAGVKKTAETAKNSVKATQAAAGRTAEKEKAAQSQSLGYKARKDREKAQQQKPANKPQSLTQRDKRIGSTDVNALRQGQNDAIRAYNKSRPTPAKPSETTPAKQARTGGSNNTVSRAVTGKPAPKPAGKVPASNAGMKNQNKDFRGNPERKDSIASTLRELRGMGSGRKASESKMSKPEDKSRYVASNGKPYKGPAFGNSKPSKPKKEDKKMSLAEEIRRRRMGQ
ncbi:hypothetical protein SYPG_00051 [Synechococcus phage S-CBP3]|uniref:Uncharacterized protein n=2 Tax=Synechococcus phage S-CBP3 TaxID=756276 RepID=A0A096VKI8_9CAUD|nr:hypothetical protein S-CBP3_0010 [Synechococcus phage S-CBP3]YP_009822282.1 hypothetical protein HOV41_gp51 [Synechococcus phage S-CBP3]AFK66501.1 hypothetical protein SYPG_00051 [Synechococcus phage S-CBP3]AGK86567.1 hypothetical protein S-CBP3_0010 [Synechococcus phage S-CBP3]